MLEFHATNRNTERDSDETPNNQDDPIEGTAGGSHATHESIENCVSNDANAITHSVTIDIQDDPIDSNHATDASIANLLSNKDNAIRMRRKRVSLNFIPSIQKRKKKNSL